MQRYLQLITNTLTTVIMVPKEVIQQITSDDRLKVPFYERLGEFLAMPEEEQQYTIELVNVFVKPRAEAKYVLIMPRRKNDCCEEMNVFVKPRAEAKHVLIMPR